MGIVFVCHLKVVLPRIRTTVRIDVEKRAFLAMLDAPYAHGAMSCHQLTTSIRPSR